MAERMRIDKLMEFPKKMWDEIAAFAISYITQKTQKGVGFKNEKEYNIGCSCAAVVFILRSGRISAHGISG